MLLWCVANSFFLLPHARCFLASEDSSFWVIHKPRGQNFGLFGPLPPSSWSLLLNKSYLIKWSFGWPHPPQVSIWFMDVPFVRISVTRMCTFFESSRQIEVCPFHIKFIFLSSKGSQASEDSTFVQIYVTRMCKLFERRQAEVCPFQRNLFHKCHNFPIFWRFPLMQLSATRAPSFECVHRIES